MIGHDLSPCGMICSDCPSLGEKCRGCRDEKGKPFWTAKYKGGIKVCPIYECCVDGKGLMHCGKCSDLPCDTYMSLSDPSDEDPVGSKKVCMDRLMHSL